MDPTNDVATLTQDFLKTMEAESILLFTGASHSLDERKKIYSDFFLKLYEVFSTETAALTLTCDNSFDILNRYTAWVDAWIKYTWDFILQEETELLEAMKIAKEQQLSYLNKVLPQKKQRRNELQAYLFTEEGEAIPMDPSEHSYYLKNLADLTNEIDRFTVEHDMLQKVIPQISGTSFKNIPLLSFVLIFARGGYGRRELSFSSDVDLGYCINPKDASELEQQVAQDLIKRMEELFQTISLDVASQFFELNEDLSRFQKDSMIHTIPSILEGRTILGQSTYLEVLQQRIVAVCSMGKLVRYLYKQLDSLQPKYSNVFRIKEGYGGIRHLQFGLWMVLFVLRQANGSSLSLITTARQYRWITTQDEINLFQALEFYFDFRNFLGLFPYYHKQLELIGASRLQAQGSGDEKNLLNDRSSMAYLKLKNRFTTIDTMDRYRLFSIQTIARLTTKIVDVILDRIISENLKNFIVLKNIKTGEIIQFAPITNKAFHDYACRTHEFGKNKRHFLTHNIENQGYFLKLDHLFELFLYIAKTGNRLNSYLKGYFSELLPQISEHTHSESHQKIHDFVFNLFTAKNTSVAVEEMLEVCTPLTKDGEITTLLGLFLPEVNQMRLLLRDLKVHEYPLCIHSIKALEQVEIAMIDLENKEPEWWGFINDNDVFALKWSVFFHDIGKTNPYRNHEEFGPVISSTMLSRLGWEKNSEVMTICRLLIRHHQSVVRFGKLSTFIDLGILKFFELAQRDPRNVILLYLVNLSDFKAVNSTFMNQTGELEQFFEKTLQILEEFKRNKLKTSINDTIQEYLDRKVQDIRCTVLLELLLRQCCHKNLEEIVLKPLSKLAPEEFLGIQKNIGELEQAVHFLTLAELTPASLQKYRRRFKQIIIDKVSQDHIFTIADPISGDWDWFFTAVPNRLLLSSSTQDLTSQLLQFGNYKSQNLRFSFIEGSSGEYDTLLFYSIGDPNIQTKIAYALGRSGVNIENGKINKVCYIDGKEGLVGFFQVSQAGKNKTISEIELEDMVSNLTIPTLQLHPSEQQDPDIQLDYLTVREKGYVVKELEADHFIREKTPFVAVKVSMHDNPLYYFKLMKAFESLQIIPQQVTITTIGKQIIDYFYIKPEQKEIMERMNFLQILDQSLHADIME